MKHNTYFDGKVQSLGVNTPDGYATVGVIEPGKYTFSTASEEHFIVIAGSLMIKLPREDYKLVGEGEKVIIKKGESFDVEAQKDAAYLCYYK